MNDENGWLCFLFVQFHSPFSCTSLIIVLASFSSRPSSRVPSRRPLLRINYSPSPADSPESLDLSLQSRVPSPESRIPAVGRGTSTRSPPVIF